MQASAGSNKHKVLEIEASCVKKMGVAASITSYNKVT